MPCSTWTTRSPSFRSRNAAAKAFSSARLRAFLRTRRAEDLLVRDHREPALAGHEARPRSRP